MRMCLFVCMSKHVRVFLRQKEEVLVHAGVGFTSMSVREFCKKKRHVCVFITLRVCVDIFILFTLNARIHTEISQ